MWNKKNSKRVYSNEKKVPDQNRAILFRFKCNQKF